MAESYPTYLLHGQIPMPIPYLYIPTAEPRSHCIWSLNDIDFHLAQVLSMRLPQDQLIGGFCAPSGPQACKCESVWMIWWGEDEDDEDEDDDDDDDYDADARHGMAWYETKCNMDCIAGPNIYGTTSETWKQNSKSRDGVCKKFIWIPYFVLAQKYWCQDVSRKL